MSGAIRLRAKQTKPGYYSYEVTLPKDLVELLGWQPGDKLLVELTEKDGKKGLFIYRP
jgi:bifunctional DNA-binding transcriptional regulator/antitoxin component of YhaV-PrlF toxin-antitoxin module